MLSKCHSFMVMLSVDYAYLECYHTISYADWGSIYFKGSYDTQPKDIQHNDTQHYGLVCDTQHK